VRLGLTTLTATETSRLGQVIDSAIARALGDNVPSLAESFTGRTLSDLDVTIDTHSAGSAIVTLNEALPLVHPGDILDIDGTGYPARTVNQSGKQLDLGVPVEDALSGTTIVIKRRSLQLPHSGRVVSVRIGSSNHELPQGTDGHLLYGATSSQPKKAEQRWDGDQDASYLALYPHPSTADTEVRITQLRAIDADADIDASNEVLEFILSYAVVLYHQWTAPGGQLSIVAAQQDKREARDLKRGGSGHHVTSM